MNLSDLHTVSRDQDGPAVPRSQSIYRDLEVKPDNPHEFHLSPHRPKKPSELSSVDADRAHSLALNGLSQQYEDRLRNLSDTLQRTYEQLNQDDVIRTFSGEATSLRFVQNRVREILEATIDSEREAKIKELMAANADCAAEIQRLQIQQANSERENEAVAKAHASQLKAQERGLNNKIEELANELKAQIRLAEQRDEEARQQTKKLEELREELNEYDTKFDEADRKRRLAEQKAAQLEAEAHNQDQNQGKLEARVQQLQERIVELGNELEEERLKNLQEAHKSRVRERELIENLSNKELEFSKQASQKLAERESEYAQQIGEARVVKQQLRYMEEKLEQEKQRASKASADAAMAEQRAAILTDKCKHMESQLSNARELLEKSERERLDLREKYLAVGEKMESLFKSEDEERWKSIRQLERQNAELQAQMSHERKQFEAQLAQQRAHEEQLKEEVSAGKRTISELQGEITKLQTEMQPYRSMEVSEKRDNERLSTLEKENKELNSKVAELTEAIHQHEQTAQAYENSLSMKNQQVIELQQKIDEVGEAWTQKVIQYQQKIQQKIDTLRQEHEHEKTALHLQYQRLVDSRIAQLRSQFENSALEESKMVATLEAQHSEFKRDHVSKEHHQQMMESQRLSLHGQFDAEKQELRERLKKEYEAQLQLHREQWREQETARLETATVRLEKQLDTTRLQHTVELESLRQEMAELHRQNEEEIEAKIDAVKRTEAVREELAEARTHIRGLEAQLNSVSEIKEHSSRSLGTVQGENSSLREQIVELKEALKESHSTIKSLQQRLEETQAGAYKLQHDAARTESEHQATVHDLQHQLKFAKDMQARLEGNLTAMTDKYETAVSDKLEATQKLKEDIFALKQELELQRIAEATQKQQSAEEAAALRRQISAFDEERSRHEAAHAAEVGRLQDRHVEELEALATRLDGKAAELDEARSSILDLQEQLKEKDDSIAALTEANEKLKKAAAQADGEHERSILGMQSAFDDERAQWKESLLRAQKEQDAQRHETTEAQSQHRNFVSWQHQRSTRLTSLTSRHCQDLRTALMSLRSVVQTSIGDIQATLSRRLHDLEWQHTNSSQHNTSQYTREREAMLREQESLSSKLRDAETRHREAVQEHQTESSASSRALSEEKAKVERLGSKLRVASEELKAQKKECSRLRNTVTESEEKIKSLKRKLDSAKEKSVRKEQMDKLEEQLDECRRALREKSSRLTQSQESLHEAEMQVKRLETEVAQLRGTSKRVVTIDNSQEVDRLLETMERNKRVHEEEVKLLTSQLAEVKQQQRTADLQQQSRPTTPRQDDGIWMRKKLDFQRVLMIVSKELPTAVPDNIMSGVVHESAGVAEQAISSFQNFLSLALAPHGQTTVYGASMGPSRAPSPPPRSLNNDDVTKLVESSLLVAEKDRRITELQESNDRLRRELAEANERIRKKDEELSQLKGELSSTKEKLRSQRETENTSHGHAKKYQTRIGELEKILQQEQLQANTLHTQLQAREEELHQVRAQAHATQTRLEEELARVANDLDYLQTENLLSMELSKVQAVAPFKAEAESLRKTIEEIEYEHSRALEQKEKELEAKLSEQRHHMEELLRLSKKADSVVRHGRSRPSSTATSRNNSARKDDDPTSSSSATPAPTRARRPRRKAGRSRLLFSSTSPLKMSDLSDFNDSLRSSDADTSAQKPPQRVRAVETSDTSLTSSQPPSSARHDLKPSDESLTHSASNLDDSEASMEATNFLDLLDKSLTL